MKKAFLFIFMILFHMALFAQSGCTDASAKNINVHARVNDGSCLYTSASVKPQVSFPLNPILVETSGLIEWNDCLYTHNDDTDTKIYQLNKSNSEIIKSYPLPNVTNVDWEEISQDEDYIYIGDFGNNYKGNRVDLKIYKIKKSSLTTTPQIEIINFSYSNQTDFTAQTPNNTDFDCEAFVVTADGILLFTKQWVSKKTGVYSLPKTAGTHIASLLTTLDVAGLITGATFKENLNLIALCGYNKIHPPFIYLIYDYKGIDFTTCNKRKIGVSLPFHQIEGIATSDGLEYYLSNEEFKRPPLINNPQELHKISLKPYLEKYISKRLETTFNDNFTAVLYSNSANDEVRIDSIEAIGSGFKISDSLGKVLKEGIMDSNTINLGDFPKGIYIFAIPKTNQTYKIIKQ